MKSCLVGLLALALFGCTASPTDRAATNVMDVSSFMRDCTNAAASQDVKDAVQILIAHFGTGDCTRTNAALLRQTSLDLSNKGLRSISPLGGLTSLAELILDNNPFTDLTPIAGLPLTTLSLNNTRATRGWMNLPLVKRLFADNTGMLTLDWLLKQLPTLEVLSVRDNLFSTLDNLALAKNLRALHIDGNNVASLQPASGLASLHVLSFDRNRVTDLAPLGPLTQLELVSALHNVLVDLRPIAPLANMTTLRISPVERTAEQCPTDSANQALNRECSGGGG